MLACCLELRVHLYNFDYDKSADFLPQTYHHCFPSKVPFLQRDIHRQPPYGKDSGYISL